MANKETTKKTNSSKPTKTVPSTNSKTGKKAGDAMGGENKKSGGLGEDLNKLEKMISVNTGGDPSKDWGEQFIVDLSPDPANVFGVSFMTDAKEYLYRTLNDVMENETERVKGFSEDEWVELLNTYALQNLGEDEKIAKIITPQNKDSFRGLIEMFIREDDFRSHILHLCALVAEPEEFKVDLPETLKEEKGTKPISEKEEKKEPGVVKSTENESIDDGGEKVHLITKGVVVNLGSGQILHNRELPPIDAHSKVDRHQLRKNPFIRMGVADFISQRKKREEELRNYRHPLSV